MTPEPGVSRPELDASEAVTRLVQLGLRPEEVAALRRQGFVCQEVRGRGRVVYKLRFRCAGNQHVRYLGKDRAVADQVHQDLACLQATTRLDRALGRLIREAKRTLRGTKARLEPLICEAGYGFHGLAIRRKRLPPDSPRNETN